MVKKKDKKFGQAPPFSGNARKKSIFSMGGVPFSRNLFRAKRNQTKMTSKDYNVLTYPEGFALTSPRQVGRVPGARVVRGGQGGQVLLQGGGVHAQHFVAHKQEAWEVEKV